ncbi:MAG TPA: cytochrome P450 [Caulobacteraceae bacterium]|jgi:cytochrome P450|nr:cytochrome P450 [Caulobacteraceae bacterium]
MRAKAVVEAPELDLDLFAEPSLREPFADYRTIRDAGPAVRLARPDCYAIGRFDDVRAALRAPDRLVSGEGVGFNDVFNAAKGMNVLQSDGELHARMRATVMKPLAPARLREARAELKAMVVARVDALTGAGEFEAMKSLSAFLPVEAVSHLVGLPEAGRERMLDWAAAAFNIIGPDQDGADLKTMGEARAFMAGLSPETVRSGSWAGDLFKSVETGRLSMVEAMAAMSAYIIPSLDTTLLAKGHLLYDLATNPEQWSRLRRRPEMIPAAVLESVRRNAVIRWFARVAADDYEVDGVVVPKGARVMLLYGSANRDERHYRDPDRFEIDRDARDQLCWGLGAHMCAGMHLARLEMEVMVEALAEANVALRAGEPTMGVNRGLYGYARLPLSIEPASGAPARPS